MFGNKLKELRKQANLTQEELGKILGVAKNTVSCWESGDNQPPIEMIIEISKTFNVSTDYLFGLENLNNLEKLIKMFLEANGVVDIKDITIDDLVNALKIVEMMKNKKGTE